MEELAKQAGELDTAVNEAAAKLKITQKRQQLDELTADMAQPDFWANNQKATQVSKESASLLAQVEPWENLQSQLKYITELIDEKDASLKSDLSQQLKKLAGSFDELKKELRFSGPHDNHDVILSIYAGAGGTDAQDWAQMLMRMYVRWAESQDIAVKTIDQSAGEEAGIKSATFELTGGSYLYGKLQGEHGVHRLVRLSPFNADHLRQTSFAKVEVLPLIDKPGELEVDEKDLKIDVFRAGGHGGQSVNTTDSAVRVTHLPTGLSVSIQNERSQLKNKETALSILRSKLVQLQTEQHAKDLSQLKGPNQSAEWGNQIRSYVLHPYKQVKDNRTGYESTEVEKVLDGNLDLLIEAWSERL